MSVDLTCNNWNVYRTGCVWKSDGNSALSSLNWVYWTSDKFVFVIYNNLSSLDFYYERFTFGQKAVYRQVRIIRAPKKKKKKENVDKWEIYCRHVNIYISVVQVVFKRSICKKWMHGSL